MSTPMKRAKKSKFIMEDLAEFLNESKPIKEPIGRKCQTGYKKKQELNGEMCKDVKGKVLVTMEQQANVRKQVNKQLLRSLSDVMVEMREDYRALRGNQGRLQQLAAALVKCVAQATAAQEQKLKSLNDIHSTFKKQLEEVEADQRTQTNNLAAEIEQDMDKLRQKLISETRRVSLENLKKTIFQAMDMDDGE